MIEEKLEKEIVNKYKSSYISLKTLSKEYNLSVASIRKIIQKYSIDTSLRKSHPSHNKIPDEKVKEAFDYYLTHDVGIRKAAKQFNLSFNTLRRYMNRNNLNDKVKHAKVTFNEDYFEMIDTEEKAYWLGMLYTDGNVRYNSETYEYRIALSLRERDKGHIKKFAECIGVKNPDEKIRTFESAFSMFPDEKFKFAILRISSKKMVQDLMKYGCIPDKTHKGKLNIEILSNLPRDLKIAFLRGYLDGDGCFHYKYGFVNISIYRKEIAEQIQQLIFDTFKMKTGLIFTESKHFLENKRIDSKQGEKNGCYSVLIYRRDDAKEFLREIYGNANIYLDAKYQKYLALEKLLKEKN